MEYEQTDASGCFRCHLILGSAPAIGPPSPVASSPQWEDTWRRPEPNRLEQACALQPSQCHPTQASSSRKKSLLLEATDIGFVWYTALSQQNLIITLSHVLMFSSVQLRPHEPQHTRPPCPSPTPRVHPNSCPLSRWCHLTISSSVVPFSSCLQSFPASGSFPMRQLFTWGGQSIGASASASVLAMISFRMDWLDLLAVPGTLKSLLQHHSSKASILQCLSFFIVQLSHLYMTTGKTIALTRQIFVDSGCWCYQ